MLLKQFFVTAAFLQSTNKKKKETKLSFKVSERYDLTNLSNEMLQFIVMSVKYVKVIYMCMSYVKKKIYMYIHYIFLGFTCRCLFQILT